MNVHRSYQRRQHCVPRTWFSIWLSACHKLVCHCVDPLLQIGDEPELCYCLCLTKTIHFPKRWYTISKLVWQNVDLVCIRKPPQLNVLIRCNGLATKTFRLRNRVHQCFNDLNNYFHAMICLNQHISSKDVHTHVT